MTSTLVDHLEQYLGIVGVGWGSENDRWNAPFGVAEFTGPDSSTVSYATLGLSGIEFRSTRSGHAFSHELLMMMKNDPHSRLAPSLLRDVGLEVLARESPLLRGEVLGPRGPLAEGSRMEAIYVASPVYLPDEFSSVDQKGRRIVIAWLVPISAREAEFVRRNGQDAFEDLLARFDPDLCDIYRPELPLDAFDRW